MAEKITVPTLGESVTEATVSKWLKSQGEKVRAEIVKDVDTILTNLEQLSKQITEEADSILENTNWGEYDALNENFMEEMLKTFKSMKFLARLQASWPGLYADKLQLEFEELLLSLARCHRLIRVPFVVRLLLHES